MGFLRPVIYSFPPSPSPDVDHYRMRAIPHETTPEQLAAMVSDKSFYKDFPYSEIAKGLNEEGNVRGVLNDLEVAPRISGLIDLCFTSVDRAGNESPPMVIDNAELDFEPPLPPGQGWIE